MKIIRLCRSKYVLIEIADRIILKSKFRSLFVQAKVYLVCLANYSKISLFELRSFESHHKYNDTY